MLGVVRQATLVARQKITEPEAEIGTVCVGARVGECVRIVAREAEATVARVVRPGYQPIALPGLQLHPGVRALPQRQIRTAQAAAADARIVGAGSDTEPDVVVEPHIPLPARRPGVDVLKAWRELVANHQVRHLPADPAGANQQVIGRGRGERLGEDDPAL